MARSTSASSGLQRRVGLLGATASGVGIILGAGIYVLVGEAAGLAGNAIWAAFLIGALIVMGTSLSYAELAAMLPEAGAASTYAREAFGRRAGFVAGWVDIAESAIAAPAVALGFGSYLALITGWNPRLIGVAALIGCALVVLAGIGETVAFATVFALVEAAGLVVVIVVGLPYMGSVNLFELNNGLGGLLEASALAFFAFVGFEEMASLAEEVKNPGRNIPRAMLSAAAVTAVLYVLVSAVSVSVVPWEELATADGPLATVVSIAASERVGEALTFVALFATLNTVLLILATGSRVMYGMARNRMLPLVFGTVWARRGSPVAAAVSVTAVAVAFALTGDIGFVAQVSNFAIFVLFVAVNGAAIRLRSLRPDIHRPFQIRPTVGSIPIPAAVGLSGSLALTAFMEPAAFIVGLAVLGIGVSLSVLFVRGSAGLAADGTNVP